MKEQTIIVRYRDVELFLDGIDGNVSITSWKWKDDRYLGRKRYMFYGLWGAALKALQELYPDDSAESIDYELAEQGLYQSEYDDES